MPGEITPQAQQAIGTMMDVLNHPNYQGELTDPAARAAVGALVVRSARAGLVLSEPTIDYAVETLGSRHNVSEPEFNAMVGDITTLSPEEAEDRLRLAHVALEVMRAEGTATTDNLGKDGHYTQDSTYVVETDENDSSREKVLTVALYVDTIQKVEEVLGQKVDTEAMLRFADEYRSHLLTKQIEESRDVAELDVDGAPTGRMLALDAAEARSRVDAILKNRFYNLVKASPEQLENFVHETGFVILGDD